VVLIYGSHRMWKCWIRKRPEWDSNHILLRLHIEMNGCPARSTEIKRRSLSRIAYADKGRRVASDLDVDPTKAGLRAKRASGAALTGKAVANRNSDRIAGCRGGKLTTTAGRYSDDHSRYLATGVFQQSIHSSTRSGHLKQCDQFQSLGMRELNWNYARSKRSF
jgi:hypothetical protein